MEPTIIGFFEREGVYPPGGGVGLKYISDEKTFFGIEINDDLGLFWLRNFLMDILLAQKIWTGLILGDRTNSKRAIPEFLILYQTIVSVEFH